jgi:hypothetical protein
MLDGFLDEFLPNLSSVERHTLDATVSHRVTTPAKLPATVENFPSRMWQRALAQQRPARLQTAAFQATEAMMLLLAASGCQEEEPGQEDEGGDSEVSCSYRVPIGDLDPVFDLVGIPPSSFDELKDKVIDKVLTEFETGNLRLYEGQGMMVRAWRDGGSQADHASVGDILAEAIRMREGPLSHHASRQIPAPSRIPPRSHALCQGHRQRTVGARLANASVAGCVPHPHPQPRHQTRHGKRPLADRSGACLLLHVGAAVVERRSLPSPRIDRPI